MGKDRPEEEHTLAVSKSETRFYYRKGGAIGQIRLSTNKVIELQKNGLLVPERVNNYSMIELICGEAAKLIPIIQGSGRYCGHERKQFRFLIPKNVRLD